MFKSFLLEVFLSCSILAQLLFNTKLIKKPVLNFLLLDTILYSQLFFILISTLILTSVTLSEFYSFNITFINTNSSVLIKALILIILILNLNTVLNSFSLQNLNFMEFASIFLLSVLSSFLIINSNDLLSFYLSIEMQSLCFYLLASFKRNSVFSSEAGLKYFIGSSFMSGIFLLGSSLIYGCLGSLSLSNIFLLTVFDLNFSLNILLITGVTLITIFLLYKIGCAPFHFLYPDVYEGSPLSSTVILTILPYLSIYVFFFNWLTCLNISLAFIQDIILGCAILASSVGTLFALFQLRLKRLVIYSSISQVGFLLSALALNTDNNLVFVFFYLIIYLITLSLIWGFALIFLNFKQGAAFEKITAPLLISSFNNLFKKHKILSFSFAVILFSIGGIPPLAGFFSKIFILEGLLIASFFTLAKALIIISSISAFYYLRIIKIIFFEPKNIEKENQDFLFYSNLKFHFLYIIFSFSLFLLFFFSFYQELLLILISFII
jgi:NADH-quinone oxidoreductase subunit N